MNTPETLSLVQAAHNEIITLRRQIANLAPKAHAYDTIAAIARLNSTQEQMGMGIDVAWRLKEAADKLEAERETERAANGT